MSDPDCSGVDLLENALFPKNGRNAKVKKRRTDQHWS